MDIKGATENVRINRVFVLSIGHNVRAFFPQGLSKLSVMMGCPF